MKPKSLIILTLLILSVFVSTARGQANREDQKLLAELTELSRKIYEAGLSGNQEFLDKHVAQDFMADDDRGDFLNTYQSVVYGAGEIRKMRREITEAHVRQRGDVAVLSYRWVFNSLHEGHPFVHILGVTDVYHRRDGIWQLFSTHRDFSASDFPAAPCEAQKPIGDRLEKITKFLTSSDAMRAAKATFRGVFVQIPDQLLKKLERKFFLHSFYIVRMERSLDISSMDANLLIAVDPRNNEVVDYLWDFEVNNPHESFRDILRGQSVSSEMEFNFQNVKVLGDLLLALKHEVHRSIGNRVGSIYSDGKVISAELIYETTPSVLLQVELNKDKFGRFSIILPPRRPQF
jgi:hypothetical protein